jgi:hypothetical protein
MGVPASAVAVVTESLNSPKYPIDSLFINSVSLDITVTSSTKTPKMSENNNERRFFNYPEPQQG